MIQKDIYPKKERNEHIGCEIEPCLLNVGAASTPPVFLLSEPNLEALKWHATYRLHSIQCVHRAGLHMGVLIGPKHAT
jgi:hypothetical protein